MGNLVNIPKPHDLARVRERSHEYVKDDGTPTCWQAAVALKMIFDAKYPVELKEIAQTIFLPEIEAMSILSFLRAGNLIEETYDFSRIYKWSNSPHSVLREATERWLQDRFQSEISSMTVEFRLGLRERLGT